MTNLALAISLDPQFPELAEELVFMGEASRRKPTTPSSSTTRVTSSTFV